MKIESITAAPVRVPLAKTLALRTGSTGSFINVLVRVRTTDGVTGYGEATPRPRLNGETVRSVTDVIDSVLAPAAVGRDIDGHQAIVAALQTIVGNACAKAAVEAAALDAFARGLGTSCYSLLGGYTRRLRCSGLLPLGPPSDVVETAVEMGQRLGVDAFKLKVGTDLDRDKATTRLLRRELPEAILLADANGGYSPDDALAFVRVAEAEGLTMIEEPTSHPGAAVRRRLTGSTFLDVVGDESCTTVEQAVGALDGGTFSGVSIKVGRTGLADSTRVRLRADAVGARVQTGYELFTSVGAAASLALAAAAPSSSKHPTEGISFLDIATDLVTNPLQVRDGWIEVPQRPGFGVEVDESVLDGLAVD